ncbi:uncharacterized protein LOC120694361 [Panicum virgatum]|uniref:uncharacterized protein LOC120694354 n=1 Tax=Panicum virgatum TaxID=38727 RepID=UPI0019D63CB9|nr:uncharacterized protein LOC120694354 [Panicum virgatum]XP_039833421.1 uncharacterized protein LOC120694361 [Panicum virgatum]
MRVSIVSAEQLNELRVKYNLFDQIHEAQRNYLETEDLRIGMRKGLLPDFRTDDYGTVWLKDRVCVQKDEKIREIIMAEAHDTRYSIHPGSTKMYKDLKTMFWWRRMKRDIASYVAHGPEPTGEELDPEYTPEKDYAAGLPETEDEELDYDFNNDGWYD